MTEVLVLQHVACEPLGTIETALHGAGLRFRYIRAQEGEPIPREIGDAAGLIIMGGPMGAYEEDRYPFLTDEKRLIGQAAARDLPTLGVCLGGQLLASVLGAPVRPAVQKEIGWYPLMLTADAAGDSLWQGISSPFPGFHWHGDCFETPPGAISLAFSRLTSCQAFRFGTNVYGFQFHLEVTEEIIRAWTAAFGEELIESRRDAAPILEGISTQLPPMQQIAQKVFGLWAALVAERNYGREEAAASVSVTAR